MSDPTNFSRSNQLDIRSITLQKPGDNETAFDIADLAEEIIIYEDLLDGSMSAKLVIQDQVNLVGSLPIIGGEIFNIQFRSPVNDDYRDLTFIVYLVAARDISNDSANLQANILYLCTPEVWWAANNDIGDGIQGTYTDIVSTLLKLSPTKKNFDSEQSVGLNTFVSPLWNMFKGIRWCASRANSASYSPFFFWETASGYHMKCLKTIYDTAVSKTIYVQDRSTMDQEDPAKAFSSTYSFEYLESNDRLKQYTDMDFGGDVFELDMRTKKFNKVNYSYDKVFNGQGVHIDGFPLNDDAKSIRNRVGFQITRTDQSNLATYTHKANLGMMDNVKLLISIPGDSSLEVGNTVWMDIPAKVGLENSSELHTSGKWLLRSMKHLIQKNTYTQICELTKDSFAVQVRKV